MTMCNISPTGLPKIHDQELLTLQWCTFAWWGTEHFTFSFAYNGCQYFVYDCVQPIADKITQDTYPRIVDILLTHIFMMGHGVCYNLFCLYEQTILRLWLRATNHPTDDPRYMTRNGWRSIDAHFHDGAGNVLQSLLPITAANSLFMTIRNLSPPDYQRYMTKHHWLSVDSQFDMEVSSSCNNLIWHSLSITSISQPF